MKIKVLGTGCAGCRALYETVGKVVAETGIDAEIVKEEDITKILEYGVYSLPALVAFRPECALQSILTGSLPFTEFGPNQRIDFLAKSCYNNKSMREVE